ncbi:hypothetical protein [Microbacterium murale]|uniref:Integral membrane protein n=1 Tax=Microbacterium murale TaxID=1081040 RepID=A0ABU0PC97_9MICO|nr:hypothetical protein [Microbacterium murale]MDQ0644972.1 hypothetical protein [Microbacterium murale]
MAHRTLITAARRWANVPVTARIAVIYVLGRLVTTGFFALAAHLSGPGSRFGADASIGSFILGWDAQWYWLVAWEGYPATLPLTESGQVAENAWAFMPLYAYAAQVIGIPFGSWGVGALLISLVAGFFACVVLYRLLRGRIGDSAALWAATFFAWGPLAALFQVGYAEVLFVLLLLVALDLVARRRFVWLYLVIVLMAFTRPGVLAFALYLGLYGILRWARRRTDPLPAREVVHIVALGALATATGFAWQVIAGIGTGDPGAYLATELSWRRNWGIDAVGFIPFDGWLQAAQFWFAQWGMPGWWGVVVLLLLVGGAAAALSFAPQVRRIGVDLRLWSASYLLYLLAVFFPQSSTFRLLMPLTPLWGAVAVPRSRIYRLGVLAFCLLGQWAWIYHMYALGNAYWQVP